MTISPFPVRFSVTSLSANDYESGHSAFHVIVTEDKPKVASNAGGMSLTAGTAGTAPRAPSSFSLNVSEEEFYKLRLGDVYVLTALPTLKKNEVEPQKPDLKKVSEELRKLLDDAMPKSPRKSLRKDVDPFFDFGPEEE